MKAERPYPQIAITPKGEEALTGGGHMGVGAPQGGHPAVQIIGHGQLFAGGLGVEETSYLKFYLFQVV